MLFIKSTTRTVAPGIYAVDVAAKPPGKTFDVFMAVDPDNPPQPVIEAIEALGFKKSSKPPYKHVDGKSILDLQFRKIGTGIFEGWTDTERDDNLKGIEKILTELGVTAMPRVMTMTEAFGI